MPFVSDADVQLHLPIDKLKVEDIPDDRSDQYEDAARIIRGYLSGVISSTIVATWLTPETTPDVIKAIAGRFAAALIYRTRYSENSLADPEFAQNKYQEAMDMLMQIINGELTIPGIIITTFDNTWFEPNNNSDPPQVHDGGSILMPTVAAPRVRIEWDPDPIVFGEAIMEVDNALNQTRIPLEAAGREIQIDIRERFETETDPSGKPWKPWSVNYAEVAEAFPNEGILRRFQFLYNDAVNADAMVITGDSLFFDESQIPEYGVWHQEGLPNRKTKGGKKNPLPQRRFLGMTMQTRAFIFATFEEWFAESLQMYTTTLNKLGRRHAMRSPTSKGQFVKRSAALPMRPR